MFPRGPIEACFKILEAGITLRGPRDLVEPIASAYRRFQVDPITLNDPVIVDAATPPLLEDLDRGFQLYQRFLETLAAAVDSCAILHGAGLVSPAGDGILIAGPSGHGKSSLTMELLARGFSFLGDDYAPLELAQGRLHPYPRAIAVVPGGDARLPEPFRQAAQDHRGATLFGKLLIDPATLLGESAIATAAVPLRQVILLGQESEPALELGALHEHAEDLDAGLREIDGVEVTAWRDLPRFRLWQVQLDPGAGQAAGLRLTRLLETIPILYCQKFSTSRPEFRAAGTPTPIRRREAAGILAREQMNRRPGSTSKLLFELAGALTGASCWRLDPGPLSDTADTIEALCLGRESTLPLG